MGYTFISTKTGQAQTFDDAQLKPTAMLSPDSKIAQDIRAASVPWYANYVATHPDEIAYANAQIADARAKGYNVSTIIEPPVESSLSYEVPLDEWIRTGKSIQPIPSKPENLARDDSASTNTLNSKPVNLGPYGPEKGSLQIGSPLQVLKEHPIAAAIGIGVLLYMVL